MISGITRNPLPASKKIYVNGELHDIRVAMREINLSDTRIEHNGKVRSETNGTVTVYDTSGPYTDPTIKIDLQKGLPRLRENWIKERADVEQLPHFSSHFCRERLADKSLDQFRFDGERSRGW